MNSTPTSADSETSEQTAGQMGQVQTLYEDYVGLVADLSSMSPSGLVALNRSYHKHLLVAAASSLEDIVKVEIATFFGRHGIEEIGSFFMKHVVARGYHTLFDWNQETAQGFFASFGDESGRGFKQSLREDESLKEQHEAFMRLGSLRNQVVHNNYANFAIDLTPKEVITKYRQGVEFTRRFETLIVSPLASR